MKPVVSMAVSVMVLAIAGASMSAHAQQSRVKPSGQTDIVFAPISADKNSLTSKGTPALTGQSKIFQFDLKGKWGLKFDVNQPQSAPSGFNDVDAGAFYKLTPSLRVGGTVGFGEKSDPLKPEPRTVRDAGKQQQPRVRLETTFKF